MFSEFKNNGFWVPVAFFLAVALCVMSTVFLCFLFGDRFENFFASLSTTVVFIACGYFFKYLDDDHIIDDNGIKHYMEFDNQFLYISMKLWIYISWTIAGFAAFGSVGSFIEAVVN